VKTKVYTEGQLHPVDLAWCAYIPFEHFESIMSLYPQYKDALRGKMRVENKHVIIAYTQLAIKDPDFCRLLESYEVFNGRAGFDVFSELFLKRRGNFAKQAVKSDEINIFECAYLQNQLCELIYFDQMDKSTIEKYMTGLVDSAKNLKPVMFYLNAPNISEDIRRLGDERINASGEKDWLQQVILYTENSPYGLTHNLKGFAGVVKGFEKRRQIELNLIKKLPLKTYIIENQDYNWDEVWKQIKEKLDVENKP
jgi:hypothetical protein